METRTHRTATKCALVTAAFFALNATANAQLVDGGFESLSLAPFSTIPGTWTTGQWGSEAGVTTGATGGITPFAGTKMLQTPNAGGFSSQTVQIVNVATQIANGTTAFTASAFFNTDLQGAAAPSAYISIHQYNSSPFWTGHTAAVSQVGVMDSSLTTWQNLSVTANMLSSTQWLTIEVSFINANLGSANGFVDDASLTPVPEPATLLALAPALAFLKRKRAR